jgi:hypothetical protein
MTKKTISGGVAHGLPNDLRKTLIYDSKILRIWNDLTPLARNEWICWTISVKQEKTRREHIKRAIAELKKGARRPCCWIGCIHRTDKAMSPSVKGILKRRSKI